MREGDAVGGLVGNAADCVDEAFRALGMLGQDSMVAVKVFTLQTVYEGRSVAHNFTLPHSNWTDMANRVLLR